MIRWTFGAILLLSVAAAAVVSPSEGYKGYIVFYDPGQYTGYANALSSAGLTPEYHFRLINADYVTSSKSLGEGGALDLEKYAGVTRVVPDYYIQAVTPEPAPLTLVSLEQSKTQISASNVTFAGTVLNGSGITVAVIDTGINYTHPDLGGCTQTQFLAGNCSKVIGGYDFFNNDNDPVDDAGHGTHCAGIIAADGNIQGVAPGARLLAVKVLNSGGGGYLSDLLKGMDYAYQNGADVVSMSLGWPTIPNDAQDVLSLAAEGLYERGITPVIAAGNDGSIGAAHGPGLSVHSITVGAVDASNALASFSSRGPDGYGTPYVDVLAPGVLINSTWNDGSYKEESGTSMATPHVAGAVALMKQAGKDPFNLIRSASDLGYDPVEQGNGLVNVSRAVNFNISYPLSAKLQVGPASLSNTTGISFSNYWSAVNVTLSLSDFKRVEGAGCSSPLIGKSNFTVSPSSFTLTSLTTVNLTANFSSLPDPGYYQGYLTVNATSYPIHKIPVILIVIQNYSIAGTESILLNTTSCFYTAYHSPYLGDTEYFRFRLDNQSGNDNKVYINVSWSGTGSDFDFYLTNLETHKTWVAETDSSLTTSEAGWALNAPSGNYVLEVRSYGLATTPKNASILVKRLLPQYLSLETFGKGYPDFGYVDNSSQTSVLNLKIDEVTGSQAQNVTISVLPAAEYWSGESAAGVVLCNETNFILPAGGSKNFTCVLNITGSNISPGYYTGKFNISSNITSGILPEYYFTRGIGTLQSQPVSSTFPINDSVLPVCDQSIASSTSARWHYYQITGNNSNLCGVHYQICWGNNGNELACYLEEGETFRFHALDNDTALFSGRLTNVSAGVHSIGVCLNEISSYYLDNYTVSMRLVYKPHISASVSGSTGNYTYRYQEPINYTVYEYDENNAGVNFTANITVRDNLGNTSTLHSNILVNTTFSDSLIYGQNYVGPLNLTVSSGACGSSVQVTVLRTPVNLSIYSQSAYKFNETRNVSVYVNGQDDQGVFNESTSLNITGAGSPLFYTSGYTNSSGFVVFPVTFNKTGSILITARAYNVSSNQSALVQNLGTVNVTTDKTVYLKQATVNYTIILLDNQSNSMQTNETLTVVFANASGVVWDQQVVHVIGMGSFSWQFPENASSGNWTLAVNDTYFNMFDQAVVFLNISYSVALNTSNQSVQPNSTTLVPITIRNNGTEQDTFNLSFSQSLGWNMNLTQADNVTLSAGENTTVYLNVSVPFEYAGTLNSITVNATGTHSSNSISFQLNVSRTVGVGKYFDNTSIYNFSLPDVLQMQMRVVNTGNVNATYNVSASYPAGWNVTFNQTTVEVPWKESRNVTFNVSIPSSASGENNITFSASMVNESVWTEPAAVITFTVPEIIITASAPQVTSTYYYTNQTTGDKMIKIPSFSASDVADGQINASQASGNCTIAGRTFNLSSSGPSFWCEMNVSNLTSNSYPVSVSMKDNRNHTGTKQITVVVPQSLSFDARLSSSSVVKGNNFYVYGNASYNGNTSAQGTVYVTVGNNNCNSSLVTQTDYSSFAVLCQAPSTAGTYVVSVSYSGVWGLNGTKFLSLSVTEPTSDSSSGSPGGGGGIIISSNNEAEENTTSSYAEEPAVNVVEFVTVTAAPEGINVSVSNPSNSSVNISVIVSEESVYAHFATPENMSVEIEPNTTFPIAIPLKPLKYARPGKYTVKIKMSSGEERTVTMSVPEPVPAANNISVFRYVEPGQNRSRVILHAVNTKNDTVNASIIETIPKTVADNVSQVKFSIPPEIVEPDPVVMFTVSLKPGESKEVYYTINKTVDPEEFQEPIVKTEAPKQKEGESAQNVVAATVPEQEDYFAWVLGAVIVAVLVVVLVLKREQLLDMVSGL